MALELRGKLNLDGSGFFGVIKQAESAAGKLQGSLNDAVKARIAGVVSIGAVTAMVHEQIEAASKIRDTADSLGVTTTELQEMQYAAEQSGSSVDAVAHALRKLAATQKEALTNSEMAHNFERLGVSMELLRTGTPLDIFRAIGAHTKDATVNTQLLADTMATMGKNSGELIPMLVSGLKELSDQAHDVGVIKDPEAIRTLAQAGDELNSVWARMSALLAPVAALLVDVTSKALDFLRIMGDRSVGTITRFFGALEGGASFKDALKAAGDFSASDKILDERIQREREKNKPKKPGITPEQIEAAQKAEAVDKVKQRIEVERVGMLDTAGPEEKKRLEDLQTKIDAEPDELKRAQLTLQRLELEKKITAEAFKRLADDQKLVALAEAREKVEKQIAEEKDPAKLLALEQRRAELEQTTREINAQKDKKDRQPRSADREAVDSFRRIGLIQGGTASNQAEHRTQKIVTALQQNRESLDRATQQLLLKIHEITGLI